MGAYYGIRNYTKKQNVSYYQKNCDYSNEQLNVFAHAFNWQPQDIITTASYNDAQIRFYCNKTNNWKTIDTRSNESFDPDQKPNNTDIERQYGGECIYEQYAKLSPTHFPTFDKNGKCTQCGLHILNSKNLEQCSTQFSDLFYMN